MVANAKRGKINSSTVSIGELLRSPYLFQVPDYQRDYAWRDEHVNALWEDIISAYERNSEEYFLGAVVLSLGKVEGVRDVVDGQQRLSSITMLFACIRDAFRPLIPHGEQQASQVQTWYLGDVDLLDRQVSPKLKLNSNNNSYFQSLILNTGEEHEPIKMSKSDPLIEKAFNILKQKLRDFTEGNPDPQITLAGLTKFIADKVHVIVIETLDDSDAFMIFETLNDRGMDLAVADLVKNFLFSKSGGKVESFKDKWRLISSRVGPSNITSFLRHVWLSRRGIIREKELYKGIQKEYNNAAKAEIYLNDMVKYSEFYEALGNSDSDYWKEFSHLVEDDVNALIKFKVTQFYPVVLAAMNAAQNSKDKDFVAKIINAVTVISFRYTVVSASGTGRLESIYAAAAAEISKNGTSALQAVLDKLKEVYIDDESFKIDFKSKNFIKSDIARYILIKINEYLYDDDISTVRPNVTTLEHILPNKMNAHWKALVYENGDIIYTDSMHEYNIDRIGNLTILDGKTNRKISNLDWESKRDMAIRESKLPINDTLKDREKWWPEDIDERSEYLADLAAKIWCIDYSS